MCKEQLVNIQTGELLDWDRVESLPDNAMLKVRPELWVEWDFEKNDELGLDIWKMTKGSNRKVGWICKNSHYWLVTINGRNRGTGCPYCAPNPKVLKGYNDMWTTNPELASLLADKENGYKYTQHSDRKLDWECSNCGEIIKNKSIANVNKHGLLCTCRKDGISYPEKVMYYLLKELSVDFEYNVSKEWSDSRMYDFIISEYNMIIETHGIQHYEEQSRGRSLKEEQENDRYKRELALHNRFNNYFEIDCRYSNMDYVKKSILNSDLKLYFNMDNINWNEIHIKAIKPFYVEVLRLWNEEGMNIPDIAKTLKLHQSTVNRKLHEFTELGLCEYDNIRSRKTDDKYNVIYQLTKDYEVVRIWSKAYDIENSLGIDIRRIYTACTGKSKTSHGYIWKYEKDVIGWSVPINNNK